MGPAKLPRILARRRVRGSCGSRNLGGSFPGKRFIANTPPDAAVLQDFRDREGLGGAGIVRHADGLNTFHPS